MTTSYSRACRLYAQSVIAVGVLPLGWALWSLVSDSHHPGWLLLASIALLSGPLAIRIHSAQVTISVSEGFIFAAALLFGPAPAIVTAVLDGLSVSSWNRHKSILRTLFSIAEPAISVCVASLLFYLLSGTPPLLHQEVMFSRLLGPLVALTTAYFALNTLILGVVFWLESEKPPLDLLRHHVPHLALDFSVSISLAALLVQTSGNLTLAAVVVLLPMLLVSYFSSRHVAGRLEDANRHYAELRRLYDSTIETLAMAIDAKDQITHGHIRRVQVLSTRLARAMGASPQDVRALEASALLHDLGKLAIPEHILNKPGRLTPAEYEQMKAHASIGAEILSGVEFPFPVAPIVRHHHENWDGSGYPDRLQGTAIPLGARILAVVDCYDALTSDRPYRRRLSEADAIEIICARSGTMYDPSVVEAFLASHPQEDAGGDAGPNMDKVLLLPARRAITGVRSPQAAPLRIGQGQDRRTKVREFVKVLGGASVHDIGEALAAFLARMQPEVVVGLFVCDESRHVLSCVSPAGKTALLPSEVRFGQGVTGWVGATHQTIENTDAALDLGEAATLTHPPLRSCVSVPVLHRGMLVAVLTAYSPYAFGELDQVVMRTLGEQLGERIAAAATMLLDAHVHPFQVPSARVS